MLKVRCILSFDYRAKSDAWRLLLIVLDEAGKGPRAHRQIVCWLMEVPSISERLSTASCPVGLLLNLLQILLARQMLISFLNWSDASSQVSHRSICIYRRASTLWLLRVRSEACCTIDIAPWDSHGHRFFTSTWSFKLAQHRDHVLKLILMPCHRYFLLWWRFLFPEYFVRVQSLECLRWDHRSLW